eukprot:TRINITY_DN1232_c1_g1_i11.p2 TRINITY_DN1232_c1_g1~~TRINITY_DN1232_c1_g1_i11.p2  ORF type:complete len:103 (-),score=16.10 TRINITY_DN1232_c1_g1_i11:95-403(-)
MHRYELARHDQLSIGLAAQRLLICVVEQHDGRVVCGTRTSGWLICIGGVNNVTFSSNVVQSAGTLVTVMGSVFSIALAGVSLRHTGDMARVLCRRRLSVAHK